MTELQDIFAELGISQYLEGFLEQGFDTWDTILDITESDFDTLGVKLGHRRKLQRRIADSRGILSKRALGPTAGGDSFDDRGGGGSRKAEHRTDHRLSTSGRHGAKRKYRRHPKPDENAPERPPSAYVIFSNKMRDDLRGRQLSFTEIAKLVGESWQNLLPEEKEVHEQQALALREKFNNELTAYKKTDNHSVYAQYLAEFKARQANHQQTTDLEIAKRPKLETLLSTSSGTASSTYSQYGDNPSATQSRVDSAASGICQWQGSGDQMSPSCQAGTHTTSSGLNDSVCLSTNSSPNIFSSATLPGHRDTGFAGSQHLLPWWDGFREDKSKGIQCYPSAVSESRSVDVTTPVDASSLAGSVRRPRMERDQNPPPLLTHESTSGSTASSSSYFTPRTPLEPSLERTLPIPSLFPQKSTGSYDRQLPPIRPPSLSPQTSIFNTQHSPSGRSPLSMVYSPASTSRPNTNHVPHPGGIQQVDFQHQTPPIRNYHQSQKRDGPSSGSDSQFNRMRNYMSVTSVEDNDLDPVSALLRAGEIVNRRPQPPPPSP